ncbi:MAG TPA: cytidine deaminase, partial [Nitrospiraceae bacterium]|nr:cytidine deaminase [Nitrospiraceae bacterium]
CGICAKMVINAGIERIVYEDGYPDELASDMIAESGITLVHYTRK